MMPVKFKRFHGEFKDRDFALLDVGCGNHSASTARRYFPKVRYTGVDRSRDYNNDPEDFKLMEAFHEIDLEKGDLSAIPDGAFDVVLFAHVIEHVRNGEAVLKALAGKLKPGGRIYVEWPGPRSLTLPSAVGTLNFCDDDTHVRVYDLKDVANALLDGGCKVLKAGTRRDPVKLAMFPLGLAFSLARRAVGMRMITHGGMWDGMGFAEYVFAEKRRA